MMDGVRETSGAAEEANSSKKNNKQYLCLPKA